MRRTTRHRRKKADRKYLSPPQVQPLSRAGDAIIVGKKWCRGDEIKKIGPLAANLFTDLFPNQSYQILQKKKITFHQKTQRSPVSRRKRFCGSVLLYLPIFNEQFRSELISKKKINVFLHFINLHNVTTKRAQKNMTNPLPTEKHTGVLFGHNDSTCCRLFLPAFFQDVRAPLP